MFAVAIDKLFHRFSIYLTSDANILLQFFPLVICSGRLIANVCNGTSALYGPTMAEVFPSAALSVVP
jgi:hypothetical protein